MRVAVLGGGLQGACVAMELAARGARVDLFEARGRCLTRASAQNEGKIHLGYVYANDRTLSTARTMVRGGLSFLPSLRRWLGDAAESIPVSRPFDYVVHRRSLLSAEEVEAHLVACRELAVEEAGPATIDYFGSDPLVAPRRLAPAEVRTAYDPRSAVAVFRTGEVAIDPEVLARLLRRRLDGDLGLRCRMRTRVTAVERAVGGLDVEFENGAGPRRERYDQVVNALWEGRLAIDRTVGLEPPRPWLWRVKHYVRTAAVRAALPCATIVLGAFGDIVAYPGRGAYLSWYPAGMRGVSRELEPPPWSSAASAGFRSEVRDRVLDGLATVMPGVARLRTPASAGAVRGGLIFAWGETDIDDPESGLHQRHAIGVRSRDGYHSIDTGKLTMAPLFARMASDRVLARA